MKIGITGHMSYPDLTSVQQLIENLQYHYRPFGNMNDDDFEEPIEILSRLRSDLDCTAVIRAAKANFTVKYMNDIDSLIEEADRVYVFVAYDKYESDVKRLMEARVPFEVIFAKENKDV